MDELTAAVNKVLEDLNNIWESLTEWFRKIKDSGVLDMQTYKARNKERRKRAIITEQIYRTKIKGFKRVTQSKRIYKPP